MISYLLDFPGSAVVELRKSDSVLRAHWVSNYDLVDVVEFIPVFILFIRISVERLELGTARDGHVECLGGVE